MNKYKNFILITIQIKPPMKSEMTTIDQQPGERITLNDLHKPEVFKALSTVFNNYIEKNGLFSMIGKGNDKKKHINVEGWMFLANFFGIITVTRSCERRVYDKVTTGGETIQLIRYHATVDAVELESGRVINTASLSAGNDESRHKYSAEYILESIAQTRATAKVLRMMFGFLASANGFNATPSEEMTEFDEQPQLQEQMKELQNKFDTLKNKAVKLFEQFKSLSLNNLDQCKTTDDVQSLAIKISTLANDKEIAKTFNDTFTALQQQEVVQDAPIVSKEQQQELENQIENQNKNNQ